MVTDDTINARQHRTIGIWLLVVCAMIFVMVVLGGITRLTHSGLSMVNWKPVTGWLPPIGDSEWRAVFNSYRKFPEYKELNSTMTLAGFKGIFWLEFFHRLWGRLIGVVFFVPLVVFLVRGWVGRKLAPKLVIMFILGGLQGGLGWYMVKSGLADRPDVSQYRLTAHLGTALVIYSYMLWVALGLLLPKSSVASGAGGRRIGVFAAVLAAWVFVTMLSGGFVAGLDAGFAYNTYPLMDGQLIPDGMFDMKPVHVNFFENITTVQFDHRLLAQGLFLAILVFWLLARRRNDLTVRAKVACNSLFAVVCVQVVLGISTLVLVVPVPLASAHQANAVILLTTALWTAYETGS